MSISSSALERRRRRNPVREARRQAELSRMRNPVVAWVATYKDSYNAFGDIIASKYIGHVAVRRFA